MFCIHCGREIDDDERFCPFCGTEIIPTTTIADVTQTASSTTALGKQKSKKGKGLIIALCLLIVVGAAFVVTGFVYPGFMKTAVVVDPEALVSTVWVDEKNGDIVYDGVDYDQGIYDALVASVEEGADRAKVTYFLDSLEFVPDKTKGLSVGDDLTLTAKYDEETLKEMNRNLRFKVSIPQDTFTYTLEALPDRSYVGVWKAVKFEAYGVIMTPAEANLTFSIDIQKDGRITATTNGEDDGSGKWETTGKGIRISSGGSSYTAVRKGSQLILEMEGISFYMIRE